MVEQGSFTHRAPSVEVSSALKLIAKGAGLTFAGLAFSKVVSYLFRLIVARLGPDEYGLFLLGFGVFDIASTIALLGLSWAVARYVPEFAAAKKQAELKQAINSSLVIALASGAVVGIVLFLLADFIAVNAFHDARVAPVIAIFALAIPFYNAGGVAIAACRGFKRIDYEVLTKYFVENGLKLALAAAVIFLGAGFLKVTAAFVAAVVVSAFLAMALLQKLVPYLQSLSLPSAEMSWKLLSYSLPLMLSNFVWLFVSWSDTVLLGYFRNVREVGIYNTAVPTAALLLLAPVALEIAFKPITVELISSKKLGDFKRVYHSLTKWIFLINAPILVFFLAFHGQVMTILFGEEYAAAGVALGLLSLGYFASSLLNLGDDILGAYDRTKRQLRNSLIAAAASVILNLMLVPSRGVAGAALATALSLAFYGVLSLYSATQLLGGFYPFSRDFARIAAAVLAAASIAYFFSTLDLFAGFAWYALVGLVFVACYAAFAYAAGAFDEEDVMIAQTGLAKLGLAFNRR